MSGCFHFRAKSRQSAIQSGRLFRVKGKGIIAGSPA
jgi:hypothetical protein